MNSLFSTLRASLSLALLFGGSAAFAADLITNGSFETASGIAPNATLTPGATNLTGWTVVGGGNLIWCDSSSYCSIAASDGSFSLDLTGLTNAAPYAGVQQTIATAAGSTYTLSFDLGGRSDSLPVSVQVSAGATTATFSSSSAGWISQSLSFKALGSATSVSIVGVSAGGSGLDLQLDNVKVAAVPEPSTPALLLVGSLVLARAGRSRAAQGSDPRRAGAASD